MTAPEPVKVQEMPGWRQPHRHLAVALWCGFLGAFLALLALLMGWDAILQAGDTPGFGILAVCFAVAWLIATLTAGLALALAPPPKPELRELDS